jgi:DNA-binding transcriptional LysR family regulator
VRAFARGQGSLRFAAFATIGAQLLPKALTRLVVQFPEVDVRLHDYGGAAEVAHAVSERRADLGLVFEYDLVPEKWPSDLQVHPVMDEEIVLIAGTKLAAATPDPVQLGDLAEATWVANREASASYQNMLRMCAQSGFSPRTRFTSDDFDVIRGLVRENLGIALAPALALGTDRSIALRRLAGTGPRRRVHAVHRTTDKNPLLPVAVEVVRQAAADFATWTTDAFQIHVPPLAATVPAS